MKESSYIAKGGLLTGLSVLFLYLAYILPTNKLAMLTLASLIIPLAILTMDIKRSLMVYTASSILILLFGLKSILLLYILFFGPYGIVKLLAERLNKTYIEIILKLIFFNASALLAYFLGKAFLFNSIELRLPLGVLLLSLQVFFFIYDYSLTILINFIQRRILKNQI